MRITTEHSASSYGIPVILDARGGPMDYAPGIKAVRLRLGLTTVQLGDAVGHGIVAAYICGRGGIGHGLGGNTWYGAKSKGEKVCRECASILRKAGESGPIRRVR